MSLVRKLENRKGRLNSDRQFDSRGMKRLDYKNIHPLYWQLYEKVYFIFFILGVCKFTYRDMFLGFYFGGLGFVVVCQIMLKVAVPVLELLVCTTMLVVFFLIAILCSNITRSCCPFWPQI